MMLSAPTAMEPSAEIALSDAIGSPVPRGDTVIASAAVPDMTGSKAAATTAAAAVAKVILVRKGPPVGEASLSTGWTL